MGVDIGSEHYRTGSSNILCMESASNMYVRYCFPKWYLQLLCVHWCIVCASTSCLPDLVLCDPLVEILCPDQQKINKKTLVAVVT
jgi:hypothetical protein